MVRAQERHEWLADSPGKTELAGSRAIGAAFLDVADPRYNTTHQPCALVSGKPETANAAGIAISAALEKIHSVTTGAGVCTTRRLLTRV